MNSGKCPSCGQVASSVTIEEITIAEGYTPAWRGVSYVCQGCQTILGVGIDPVALKADTVEEVLHDLGKRT